MAAVQQKKTGFSLASLGIAVLCFGYFAAYIPYSMMTKMITKKETMKTKKRQI